MSYERYKDFKLGPDGSGGWTVLDKELQKTETFPSKAAAKRWIDKERLEAEIVDKAWNDLVKSRSMLKEEE